MGWWRYKSRPTAAQRRATLVKELAKLKKRGQNLSPVTIAAREIAHSFWGRAWCGNLAAYSDFSNRLPRGRTYVRNGSVIDLQIDTGRITALVSGSKLYRVEIAIAPLAKKQWKSVKSKCAGQIGSLVELLQGRLSASVMRVVTDLESGLFPRPVEISMSCSCPDGAWMCKHICAALYGVGARLDEQPHLLFTLRQVDHAELIDQAGLAMEVLPSSGGAKTIEAAELSNVFGIEFEDPPTATRRSAKSNGPKKTTRITGSKRASRPSPEEGSACLTEENRKLTAEDVVPIADAVAARVRAKPRKTGSVKAGAKAQTHSRKKTAPLKPRKLTRR